MLEILEKGVWMTPLKLGVVGTGRLGGFHAAKAAVNPKIEFVGVYDADFGRCREVAAQHQVTPFASLDELAKNVEAAVIAAPTVLHHELAKHLLQRKIHLLVEKPVTVLPEDAEELVAIAKKKDVALLVGHTEQFNMAWRDWHTRICELLEHGPALIDAKRTSGYTFRSVDVGAVLDLMIHDIELVLSIVPHEVVSVEAIGFSSLGGHEDTAEARVTFADDTVARFFASRVSPQAVRSMTIQSKHRWIEIDFAARKTVSLTASKDVVHGTFAPGQQGTASIATFMQDHFSREESSYEAFDALALEMNDFAETVLCGRPSSCLSGQRAAKAVRVATQILEKIRC